MTTPRGTACLRELAREAAGFAKPYTQEDDPDPLVVMAAEALFTLAAVIRMAANGDVSPLIGLSAEVNRFVDTYAPPAGEVERPRKKFERTTYRGRPVLKGEALKAYRRKKSLQRYHRLKTKKQAAETSS